MMKRLRDAIQWCKNENEYTYQTDHKMESEQRMVMETCLIKNYLVKHGMDYFGKRDLIYIDMMGTEDVDLLGSPDKYITIPGFGKK